MIPMKIITATMAKNIATKMKDCPEVANMMDVVLCKSLQGKRSTSFRRSGQSTSTWESYQVFFAGLGYEVEDYPNIGQFEIRW